MKDCPNFQLLTRGITTPFTPSAFCVIGPTGQQSAGSVRVVTAGCIATVTASTLRVTVGVSRGVAVYVGVVFAASATCTFDSSVCATSACGRSGRVASIARLIYGFAGCVAISRTVGSTGGNARISPVLSLLSNFRVHCLLS